jgi:hypothetical protein
MAETRIAPTPREPAPLLVQTRDAGLSAVLCAALWQLRHQLKDMTLAIDLEEVEKFEACLTYNEQKPKLQINVTHQALTVSMVDAKTNNGIIQSESSEKDQDRKEAANQMRLYASQSVQLVNDHRAMIASGQDSDSLTNELYAALLTLAKAYR